MQVPLIQRLQALHTSLGLWNSGIGGVYFYYSFRRVEFIIMGKYSLIAIILLFAGSYAFADEYYTYQGTQYRTGTCIKNGITWRWNQNLRTCQVYWEKVEKTKEEPKIEEGGTSGIDKKEIVKKIDPKPTFGPIPVPEFKEGSTTSLLPLKVSFEEGMTTPL